MMLSGNQTHCNKDNFMPMQPMCGEQGKIGHPRRLIIQYALSAKAQVAQWAYVGRYLFYYVFQKLIFGDAL